MRHYGGLRVYCLYLRGVVGVCDMLLGFEMYCVKGVVGVVRCCWGSVDGIYEMLGLRSVIVCVASYI